MLRTLRRAPFSITLIVFLSASVAVVPRQTSKAFTAEKSVDSLMTSMSTKEKIGQLFMIASDSRLNETGLAALYSTVKRFGIGGVIFSKGGPCRQAAITERLQKLTKIPLLISMDAESGPGMRLDSLMTFPKEMALGAIRDNALIYKMGLEIARQCRLLGVQMNMAPVVDVNDGPYNPVINERSFGENRMNVADKGEFYMKGLQDGGVLAVAKHFPGHGDSFQDSHQTLPLIDRTAKQIDSIELYPFKQLIAKGISGVMTAHLSVPALDRHARLASSLSKPIVTGLLKNVLGFSGITVTDAMNMRGAGKLYAPAERDVKALLAGNDIILHSSNVAASIMAVNKALNTKVLSIDLVNTKVRKILMAKYLAGAFSEQSATHLDLVHRINSPQAKLLREQLIKASITVLGQHSLLPLEPSEASIAEVSIGDAGGTFQQTLKKYAAVRSFSCWKDASARQYEQLTDSLKNFQVVLVALHSLEKDDNRNYGIRGATREFIDRLQSRTRVVLVVFGNPYLLSNFAGLKNVVVAYEDSQASERVAAEVIFGATGANGILPINASHQFKVGDGVEITATGRLPSGLPEQVGMSSDRIDRIDSIVRDGISRRAYSACAVVAVKEGKIIYEKAFGTHTFEDRTPVLVGDLFDLASVTKVASTTLATMKLYDQGLLDLDAPISKYLPELLGTNKEPITSMELLSHQAGLVPYIAFYKAAMRSRAAFSPDSSSTYPVRVALGLYLSESYSDGIWKQIVESPIRTRGKYVYSDLSMYFMRAVIERLTRQRIDTFVTANFYRPLGLVSTGFNPRDHFPGKRIVPTEDDRAWRKQLLVGFVHDQGAAMQGGVAGHAGLFSSALELSIIGQMLLEKGYYAGRRYIKESTVNYFNTRHFPGSRRGLGFDKPEPNSQSYPGAPVSDSTFGHTGFTGTCLWVDPSKKLVYVFLSNRLCPGSNINLLSALSIRPKIHRVLYE